jgi:repressor LexA
MNEAQVGNTKILSGNYLIIDKNAEISDGDIVVAVIENSATVKKIKRLEDMIVLYPQSNNPIHQPIFLSLDFDGLINGKVIKVLENPAI